MLRGAGALYSSFGRWECLIFAWLRAVSRVLWNGCLDFVVGEDEKRGQNECPRSKTVGMAHHNTRSDVCSEEIRNI